MDVDTVASNIHNILALKECYYSVHYSIHWNLGISVVSRITHVTKMAANSFYCVQNFHKCFVTTLDEELNEQVLKKKAILTDILILNIIIMAGWW